MEGMPFKVICVKSKDYSEIITEGKIHELGVFFNNETSFGGTIMAANKTEAIKIIRNYFTKENNNEGNYS